MFNRLGRKRCLLVGLSGLAACLARTPGDPFGDEWFLEGDGGGGAGGGQGDPPRRENPADIAARYSGDAVRLASDLAAREHDNYTLREKNRDLRDEVTTLKKQVPGEGAVVLTKEQAEQWAAFQKLGLKPDEIATQLAAGKTATERAARYEREGVKGVLDLAAEAEKFAPDVLKLLGKDLPIEMRDVDVTDAEGKTSKQSRPFIVAKDGEKEKLTGLRDHFKAQGDTVLGLLEAGNNGHGNNGGGPAGGNSGGTHWPAQGAGGGKADAKPRNRYEHNLDKQPA